MGVGMGVLYNALPTQVEFIPAVLYYNMTLKEMTKKCEYDLSEELSKSYLSSAFVTWPAVQFLPFLSDCSGPPLGHPRGWVKTAIQDWYEYSMHLIS